MNTHTITGTTVGTVTFSSSSDQPKPTRDLFEVVVNAMNELELRPLTDLARSLVSMWVGQKPRLMITRRGQGPGKSWKYGCGVELLNITFSNDALLSSGDDAYHTGMGITDEEYQIARKAIERSRKRKQKELTVKNRKRSGLGLRG